jgi:SulP family sulfate permease
MDGSLNYDLDTLKRLTQADTVPLWMIPLVLAIILFAAQSRITSKYFLPLYILAIPAVFYASVAVSNLLNPDRLRDGGWIFEGPPAGEPWWYFYTLYSNYSFFFPSKKVVRWLTILQNSTRFIGQRLCSASRPCLR